jgi:hypothetical protein
MSPGFKTTPLGPSKIGIHGEQELPGLGRGPLCLFQLIYELFDFPLQGGGTRCLVISASSGRSFSYIS